MNAIVVTNKNVLSVKKNNTHGFFSPIKRAMSVEQAKIVVSPSERPAARRTGRVVTASAKASAPARADAENEANAEAPVTSPAKRPRAESTDEFTLSPPPSAPGVRARRAQLADATPFTQAAEVNAARSTLAMHREMEQMHVEMQGLKRDLFLSVYLAMKLSLASIGYSCNDVDTAALLDKALGDNAVQFSQRSLCAWIEKQIAPCIQKNHS